MKNPNGDTTGTLGDFKLQNLDLPETSDETSGSRKKRAIFINRTTTVENDTNEIIICSLKASGTGFTNHILATASLLLGGVGLVAALNPAFPVGVGVFIAAVGWHVAVGGAVQLFNSSGKDTSAVMFPFDTMQRTSSGSFLTSNNDLHIILVRVDNSKHRLVISTAKIEETGNDTLFLSQVLPSTEFNQLLSIHLPSDMRLLAYRNIVIPGLYISLDEKSISTMTDDNIPNAVTTFTKSNSELKWFGTLDDFFAEVEKGSDHVLFRSDSDVSLTFTQGVTGSGGIHAEVLAVNLDNGKELILLKIRNCYITSTLSVLLINRYFRFSSDEV